MNLYKTFSSYNNHIWKHFSRSTMIKRFLVGASWRKRDYYSDFFSIHTDWTKQFYKSSAKYYGVKLEPVGLMNWAKKTFPVFPRNIQRETKGSVSLFSFFRNREIFYFPQRVRLQFVWCLATEWMLKYPKWSPVQFSRHCEIFFERKFSQRVPLQFFDVLKQWMLKIRKGPIWVRFGSTFGFFGYCKRILDTLKSFCYFEP